MPKGVYQRRPQRPLAERFFAKVDLNGPTPVHRPELGPCHIWTAARDTAGYGRERQRQLEKQEAAHRAELEAMRPDLERLLVFSVALRAVPRPTVTSPAAKALLSQALGFLGQAIESLEDVAVLESSGEAAAQ